MHTPAMVHRLKEFPGTAGFCIRDRDWPLPVIAPCAVDDGSENYQRLL